MAMSKRSSETNIGMKRTSEESVNEATGKKVFKPEVKTLTKEELFKKFDKEGNYVEQSNRIKVSELPQYCLLKIESSVVVKIEEESLQKLMLVPALKKGDKTKYEILLNSNYKDVVATATHLSYFGQKKSKNNRTYNRIEFFSCCEGNCDDNSAKNQDADEESQSL